MKRIVSLLALGLAIISLAVGNARAQQPGDPFPGLAAPRPGAGLPGGVEPAVAAGRQGDERPVNPFPPTPALGACMICAATYMGPDAFELARQVALELRERHK